MKIIPLFYRTNPAGKINKTVTVTSNALKNFTVVLRIKGYPQQLIRDGKYIYYYESQPGR